eukprot:1427185-Prymnesium_polylepis.1
MSRCLPVDAACACGLCGGVARRWGGPDCGVAGAAGATLPVHGTHTSRLDGQVVAIDAGTPNEDIEAPVAPHHVGHAWKVEAPSAKGYTVP